MTPPLIDIADTLAVLLAACTAASTSVLVVLLGRGSDWCGDEFSIAGDEFSIAGDEFSIAGDEFSIASDESSIAGDRRLYNRT
jgi:hypothetical protein